MSCQLLGVGVHQEHLIQWLKVNTNVNYHFATFPTISAHQGTLIITLSPMPCGELISTTC